MNPIRDITLVPRVQPSSRRGLFNLREALPPSTSRVAPIEDAPRLAIVDERVRNRGPTPQEFIRRLGRITDLNQINRRVHAALGDSDALTMHRALLAIREDGIVSEITAPNLLEADVYEYILRALEMWAIIRSRTREDGVEAIRNTSLAISRQIAPPHLSFVQIADMVAALNPTTEESLYDLLSYVFWMRRSLLAPSTIHDRIVDLVGPEALRPSGTFSLPATVVAVIDQASLRYIDMFIHGNYSDIIYELELVVPPTISDEVYLEEIVQIVSSLVIDRGEGVDSPTVLSDIELFNRYGALPYYSTRTELVNNISSLENTPAFFMPLRRTCNNAQTYLLSDTNDPSVEVISYGTIQSYRCYEVDELIGLFSTGEVYPFTTGEGLGSSFPIGDIMYLRNLSSIYPSMRNLTETIDRGVAAINRNMNIREEHVEQFNRLPDRDKEALRVIFNKFIAAGMFMRRWTGTGCYPLREEDTRSSSIDPNVRSIPALIELRSLIDNLSPDAMSFFIATNSMSARHGEVIRGTRTLLETFDEVYRGVECIRMASKRFIVSGITYLSSLYGILHPEINLEHLDSVQ